MLGFDVLELTDAAPPEVAFGGSGGGVVVTPVTATTLDLLRAPYGLAIDEVDLGVSRARAGSLGGRGHYEEVVVTLALLIQGDCVANVYAAHARLVALLEQAQRWTKDETAPPVRLIAQATGSSVAPVAAIVLRLRDAEAALALPPVYEADDGRGYVARVTIQFLRSGTWLATEAPVTATGQVSGTLCTLSFASAALLASPVRVGFTGGSNTTYTNNAALLVASDAISASGGAVQALTAGQTASDKLKPVGVPSGGSGFSTVAEPGLGSGTVFRYTPGTTNPTQPTTPVTVAMYARRILVYGVARNNNISQSYQVQLIATPIAGTAPNLMSTIQPLELPDTRPNVVFLGTILAPVGIQTLTFALQASATGGSLDFSYLVVVNADDETTNIVTYNLAAPITASANSGEVAADPRVFQRPSPIFGLTGSGANSVGGPVYAQPWLGDAFFTTRGQNLAAVLMQPGGANWRADHATPNTFVMRALRFPAYLTLP